MLVTSKIQEAIDFATKAHSGQFRKYSSNTLPYITHPIEVATLVSRVDHTEDMLVAAVLHDVVEDTDVSLADIQRSFGNTVYLLVEMLTDISDSTQGNRKLRKELDRQHTAKASPAAKTIKLADLISNTTSIVEHDKNFARVYLKEKELLLHVLTDGDKTLLATAQDLLMQSKLKLLENT